MTLAAHSNGCKNQLAFVFSIAIEKFEATKLVYPFKYVCSLGWLV
jgi:hypothetical protein